MPEDNLPKNERFYHVYNSGVEKRDIFISQEDYETFTRFLQDYLSDPSSLETVKKVFTIRGHTYKGTPHLPKNHLNKIELVAYSLMPNHFHLIVAEKEKGAVTGFIRSLCTRYSMYYNKKHTRSGPLYHGPFKSVRISDSSHLAPLINFIHHGVNVNSTYFVYKGEGSIPWVNSSFVQIPLFQNENSPVSLPDYLTLENGHSRLERSQVHIVDSLPPATPEVRSRIPHIATLFASFVLLVGFGMRNVSTETSKTFQALADNNNKAVLSETVETTPTPVSIPQISKTMAIINVPPEREFVDLYKKSNNFSEKVGEAKDGEMYELVSEIPGWYEIKLTDGKVGFVPSDYANLKETN